MPHVLLPVAPAPLTLAVAPPEPPPVRQDVVPTAPSPPRPPDTSTTPAIVASPVARRSSTPAPFVVIVTPAGMLIVVK
jgi:hypothetical protein